MNYEVDWRGRAAELAGKLAADGALTDNSPWRAVAVDRLVRRVIPRDELDSILATAAGWESLGADGSPFAVYRATHSRVLLARSPSSHALVQPLWERR